MQLKSELVKSSAAYDYFNCNEYLRIYILWVHPSYANRGVEAALLNAAVEMALSLELPAVGGVFSSSALQETAKEVGFEVLSEILYGEWLIDEEVVFLNPGENNYTVALMGMLTPSFEELKEQQEDKKLTWKASKKKKKMRK